MVLDALIYTDILPYAAAFLIVYAVVFLGLSKSIFKGQKQTTAIIAIAVGVLAVWGFARTNMFFEFESFFNNLSDSLGLVIFVAVLALIVILLWKGLGKMIKSKRVNWILVGGGLLLGFIGLFPGMISSYYLPAWFDDYGSLSLWVGGLFLIAAVYDSFNFSKTKVLTVGGGGSELTRTKGTFSSKGFWGWMLVVGGLWTLFYFGYLLRTIS